MKSDLALQEDVAEELSFDPRVDARDVGVAAKDGIVTLTGKVPAYADRLAAEKAAKRVSGVRAVALDLEVELPEFHRRDDTEIAAAAVNALDWEITVPKDAIVVTVRQGWVMLEGHVTWEYQRENAEQAVRHLIGVVGVTNQILVAPPAIPPADVAQTIRKTFERSADIDAGRITVESKDGVVTLHGTVRSWAEHEDAARAAYAVPGVTRVENKTFVGV